MNAAKVTVVENTAKFVWITTLMPRQSRLVVAGVNALAELGFDIER